MKPAPFTYHDESGKLTGYDVEVTRAVADKLGVKVDFKETQWDAMLAGLKAGRFDIVANQVSLTTPERRATFDKSADYSYSGPMALTRQDDQRIKTLADVKGLSSAQSLSSNYGEMAEKAGAKIVPVDGMAQALALVQQGRADFTFNDSLALLDYLKKNPNSGLQVAWTAPADEKNSAAVTEANATVDAGPDATNASGTATTVDAMPASNTEADATDDGGADNSDMDKITENDTVIDNAPASPNAPKATDDAAPAVGNQKVGQ